MKTDFLFPKAFKIPGLLLFLAGVALFLAVDFYNFEFSFLKLPQRQVENINSIIDFTNNYTLSLSLSAILLGLIFFGFSKLKIEDEMIALIRLKSLQWSIYITVLCLILVTIFTFSFVFTIYSVLLWFVFFIDLLCTILFSNFYVTNKTS